MFNPSPLSATETCGSQLATVSDDCESTPPELGSVPRIPCSALVPCISEPFSLTSGRTLMVLLSVHHSTVPLRLPPSQPPVYSPLVPTCFTRKVCARGCHRRCPRPADEIARADYSEMPGLFYANVFIVATFTPLDYSEIPSLLFVDVFIIATSLAISLSSFLFASLFNLVGRDSFRFAAMRFCLVSCATFVGLSRLFSAMVYVAAVACMVPRDRTWTVELCMAYENVRHVLPVPVSTTIPLIKSELTC